MLERYIGGVVGTVDVDGNTLTASFSGTQDNTIGTLCVGNEPGAHNDIVHSIHCAFLNKLPLDGFSNGSSNGGTIRLVLLVGIILY